MKRHVSTALACGVLAASSVTGSVPPAGADVDRPTGIVLRDGPGDVWRLDLRAEESTMIGDFPRADVVRAVVRHRPHEVFVRMRFVDLRRSGWQEFRLGIKTRAYHFGAVVVSEQGHRAGKPGFWGDDGSTSCQGFTGDVGYADEVVTMHIPRSCLHDPRWVRLGVSNNMHFDDRDVACLDNPMDHEAEGPETGRLFVATD